MISIAQLNNLTTCYKRTHKLTEFITKKLLCAPHTRKSIWLYYHNFPSHALLNSIWLYFISILIN